MVIIRIIMAIGPKTMLIEGSIQIWMLPFYDLSYVYQEFNHQ